MGMIKGRNVKDVTEAEKIMKRWKNTQNYTKKVLNDLVNHSSMVIHLARHSGVWSQVDPRNHYYQQS